MNAHASKKFFGFTRWQHHSIKKGKNTGMNAGFFHSHQAYCNLAQRA